VPASGAALPGERAADAPQNSRPGAGLGSIAALWRAPPPAVMVVDSCGRIAFGAARVHASHHLTVHEANGAVLLYCPRCIGMARGAAGKKLAHQCEGCIRSSPQKSMRKRLLNGLWPTLGMQCQMDPAGTGMRAGSLPVFDSVGLLDGLAAVRAIHFARA